MRSRALLLAVSACLALSAFTPMASSRPPRKSDADPVVIAVIESGGLNVFHSDFRVDPGEKLKLPAGMPTTKTVRLPASGSFEERVATAGKGPLGSLKPGQLYRVAGTKIIGIYVGSSAPGGVNLLADRDHATGTTSSAVGEAHGTYPEALLVFIPDTSAEAWEWLAEQDWIDVVSTSYFTLIGISSSSSGNQLCGARNAIRDIVESGRLVFSAAGNAEMVGPAFQPSGVPESYQVGGVDDEGRSYRPDAQAAAITPTRPYETGDRFEFPAADPDALSGSAPFGGTSGATPSTAGRAAELIAYARGLLGGGRRDGSLATAPRGAKTPRKGPLGDGRLEASELTSLLHHVAVPKEPPSPVRYLVEGYGALTEEAVALGKQVLAGKAPEPERSEEDEVHSAVEQIRSLWFSDTRCG